MTADPSGITDVFLSYSSKDKTTADAVVSDLEGHGIKCWYAPRDIMPGREWVSAINDAIKGCRLFILLYTDRSNESGQVANEIALAFNSKKTIIPFKLSDASMSSELEYYLTRVQWLDAVNVPYDESIERLRTYTEKILAGEAPAGAANATDAGTRRKRPIRILLPVIIIIAITILAVILLPLSTGDRQDGTEDESIDQSETSPEESSTPETHTDAPASQEDTIAVLYEKARECQAAASDRSTYDRAYELYMQTGDEPCDDEMIVDAMYDLASYFYEEGEDESIEKGLQLFKKAAASGSISANNILGNYNLQLDMENRDKDTAADMVEYDGTTMSAEVRTAIIFYEASAGRGDAVALFNLGYIYENGAGYYNLEPDIDKAISYYERAGRAGHRAAQLAYERLTVKSL